MAISNLSSQYISASYQNLLQISASGEIFNGSGTQVTNLVLTSVTASFNGLVSSASAAITADTANTATSASYATTASFALTIPSTINGNLAVNGTLTANTYIVSSSVVNMTVEYASGSTAFGDSSDDTHTFIGSVTVTGSFLVSGSSTFRNIGPAQFTGSVTSTQGFTGSLSGTATNASTASYISPLFISASVASSGFGSATPASASYALSASYSNTSIYADTASYISPTFISASAAASGFGSGGGISTPTGSLLTTASVSLNTITFTKGDSSTFSITVNTGSAGAGGLSGSVNSGGANKIAYYPSAGTTVDDTTNLEYTGTSLKLLSTTQLEFYTDLGSIYFGTFGQPSYGRAGFSVPGAAVMVVDYTTARAGFGGGTNLISSAPTALVDIQGKTDEVQLLIKSNGTQTANLTEWKNSGGTVISSINPSGNFIGTSSWAQNALTASYAANASSFPYTGTAAIDGTLQVTGSVQLLDNSSTATIQFKSGILSAPNGIATVDFNTLGSAGSSQGFILPLQPPAVAATGSMYFDPTGGGSATLYIYDGTNWRYITLT